MLRLFHMAVSKKDIDSNEYESLIEKSHFLTSEIQFSAEEKLYAHKHLRWCSIIYWEYDRVSSKQFHVFDNELWVYQENELVNKKSNLCLRQYQRYADNCELIKTREQISRGIFIRLTKNRVFIENKCDTSIFWTKPSLEADWKNILPKEIRKDSTIQVFNMKKLDRDNYFMNTNVVNLSLGKQWGRNNTKRPSIEFCPCWISINFNKNFNF